MQKSSHVDPISVQQQKCSKPFGKWQPEHQSSRQSRARASVHDGVDARRQRAANRSQKNELFVLKICTANRISTLCSIRLQLQANITAGKTICWNVPEVKWQQIAHSSYWRGYRAPSGEWERKKPDIDHWWKACLRACLCVYVYCGKCMLRSKGPGNGLFIHLFLPTKWINGFFIDISGRWDRMRQKWIWDGVHWPSLT